MDLNMIPILKQYLQDKTVNSEKNISYYKRYDVKRMRSFHKQSMMKQKIYKNILMGRSGMDYSPGIRFETIIVNMDKEKSLTEWNQPEKYNHRQQIQFRRGSIKHLHITLKDCPVGISYRKAKKLALGMGISLSKTNNSE